MRHDSAPDFFPTKYWHRVDDGRVQCDVCPRACRLNEGQRGLCFVRARERDAVVLTTYGRSSGFCVDPIEKKPLNHFYPGTSVLSFGTAGCNLSCRFCQNWDISKSREIDTLADAASPATIARAAQGVDQVLVPELNLGQYVREVERVVGGGVPVRGIHWVDGEMIHPGQILQKGGLS